MWPFNLKKKDRLLGLKLLNSDISSVKDRFETKLYGAARDFAAVARERSAEVDLNVPKIHEEILLLLNLFGSGNFDTSKENLSQCQKLISEIQKHIKEEMQGSNFQL